MTRVRSLLAPSRWLRATFAIACILAAAGVLAAADTPDPKALLQDAKNATGGKAWDVLSTQHSRVQVATGNRTGVAERWASLLTGRSRTGYSIGGRAGVIGFDGFVLWTQDALAKPVIERDPELNRLAINTAYRDRLAFWYPERQAATVEYARHDRTDNTDFDVVRIIPEGGLAYEVWVNAATHRIERMREPDAMGLRTEIYSDFRDVQGVRVPFTVQTSHAASDLDERYTVVVLEYNVALDNVRFEPSK